MQSILKHQKLFNILFLAVFLFLSLFINFFHIEDCLQSRDTCPACRFQNSTLATAQIPFFHLPQLTLLDILQTIESDICQQGYIIHPLSRSPPSV